jgi:F-type H+-transporting ATPase subunit gamma
MASSNMKDIKRRIKSVESTLQITKAMELVASSKLRRAKERADNVRPFFESLYKIMWEITSEDNAFESVFTNSSKGNSVLLIVIAGDRGLAGGFNSNIFKLAQKRIDEINSQSGTVSVMPIGRKAVEYFQKRENRIVASYENIAEHIKINQVMKISELIIGAYTSGKINRVEIIFTNYVSPLLQEARNMSVLPVENISGGDVKKSSGVTNYEPSPEAVFDTLVPKYLAGIIYGAVADSFASEQASRRLAMENASDNATEMIYNLSLIYNRARQSSITQEITEIVGGASAQE